MLAVGLSFLSRSNEQGMMKKNGKNPADFRPDILHQVCFGTSTHSMIYG